MLPLGCSDSRTVRRYASTDNPWAYYMMASNHLRVNNDTKFLHMQAASSNQTVEDALEGIATDFQEYLIP
jgi:hypothetical protein